MRKGMSQGIARPVYYDRNPIVRGFTYEAGGVAPHTSTQRYSYTVPAGKKGFFESAGAAITREAVATTSSFINGEIRYTPSGGSFQRILLLYYQDNNIGIQHVLNVPNYGSLGTGDVISCFTQDISTGGSNNYALPTKIIEFDA